MNSSKVFLGLLAGIAAGAVLGILFAPDKGSKTREKVGDMAEEYGFGLEEKFNNFMDNISKKMEVVNDLVKTLADKGKSKAENIKKDVKTAGFTQSQM